MTKVYKRVLASLMSSVHCLEVGQEYLFEHEHTDNEKQQVMPAEMVRWLNVRTFGVPNPGTKESICPLVVHAHTLAFLEKGNIFSHARSSTWMVLRKQ